MARTMLVVDDSVTIRQMVKVCLSASGFVVLEANDGQDGLTKVQAQKVDLVITDLHMPRMDGIELVKKIRALPQYKYTPILILTTEALPARKQEGQQAGATGWFVKPFEPEQLLKVVKRVLPG